MDNFIAIDEIEGDAIPVEDDDGVGAQVIGIDEIEGDPEPLDFDVQAHDAEWKPGKVYFRTDKSGKEAKAKYLGEGVWEVVDGDVNGKGKGLFFADAFSDNPEATVAKVERRKAFTDVANRKLDARQRLLGQLDYIEKRNISGIDGFNIGDIRKSLNSKDFLNTDDAVLGNVSVIIEDAYDKAQKGRGIGAVAADALKRGYRSTGTMLYTGAKMYKPGQLSDEDKELVKAAVQAGEEADIQTPRKAGSIKDVKGAGDFLTYAAESILENAPRGLGSTAAGLAGGMVGGPAGAAAGVFAAGLPLNTGEAVGDIVSEGRSLDRGFAIAQGAGYSALDAAFGGEVSMARVLSSSMRQTAAQSAKKSFVSSVKSAGREILKEGLGEAVTEPAQSQIIGRGVRLAQTGSALRTLPDGSKETGKDIFFETADESIGGFLSALGLGAWSTGYSAARNARLVAKADRDINALALDVDVQNMHPYDRLMMARYVATATAAADSRDALSAGQGTERDVRNLAAFEAGLQDILSAVDKGTADKIRAFETMFADTTIDAVPQDFEAERPFVTRRPETVMREGGETVQRVRDEESSGITIEGNEGAWSVFNEEGMKMPRGSVDTFTTVADAVSFAKELARYNEWRAKKNATKAQYMRQLAETFHPGANIVLIDSPQQVDNESARMRMIGGEQAFYSKADDTVYIMLDALSNPVQAAVVMAHESGHKGLADLVADEAFQDSAVVLRLREIGNKRRMLKAKRADAVKKHGADSDIVREMDIETAALADEAEALDERVASARERIAGRGDVIERGADAVGNWARRTFGIRGGATEADVRTLARLLSERRADDGNGGVEYRSGAEAAGARAARAKDEAARLPGARSELLRVLDEARKQAGYDEQRLAIEEERAARGGNAASAASGARQEQQAQQPIAEARDMGAVAEQNREADPQAWTEAVRAARGDVELADRLFQKWREEDTISGQSVEAGQSAEQESIPVASKAEAEAPAAVDEKAAVDAVLEKVIRSIDAVSTEDDFDAADMAEMKARAAIPERFMPYYLKRMRAVKDAKRAQMPVNMWEGEEALKSRIDDAIRGEGDVDAVKAEIRSRMGDIENRNEQRFDSMREAVRVTNENPFYRELKSTLATMEAPQEAPAAPPVSSQAPDAESPAAPAAEGKKPTSPLVEQLKKRSFQSFFDAHEGQFALLEHWYQNGKSLFSRPKRGSGGEYDAFKKLPKSLQNTVVGKKPTSTAIDEAVQELAGTPVLPNIDKNDPKAAGMLVDEFVRQYEAYKKWKEGGAQTMEDMEAERYEYLRKQEEEDALTKPKTVDAVDMDVGDLVKLDGEWHSVSKEAGDATILQDGYRYAVDGKVETQAYLRPDDAGYELALEEYRAQEAKIKEERKRQWQEEEKELGIRTEMDEEDYRALYPEEFDDETSASKDKETTAKDAGKPALTLEQQTPEEVDAERKRLEEAEKARKARDEIARRAAAPITGTAGDLTADMFGEQEGETPLFNARRDTPAKPSAGAMQKEAQRWQGAHMNAEKMLLDAGDRRGAMAVATASGKSNLDDYLMKKFGVDRATAHEVSNTLTQFNIPADRTAKVEDFAGEEWADAAIKSQAAVKDSLTTEPSSSPTAPTAPPRFKHGVMATTLFGKDGVAYTGRIVSEDTQAGTVTIRATKERKKGRNVIPRNYGIDKEGKQITKDVTVPYDQVSVTEQIVENVSKMSDREKRKLNLLRRREEADAEREIREGEQGVTDVVDRFNAVKEREERERTDNAIVVTEPDEVRFRRAVTPDVEREFASLTSTLKLPKGTRTERQAALDEWIKGNPKEYAALEKLRGDVLKAAGYTIKAIHKTDARPFNSFYPQATYWSGNEDGANAFGGRRIDAYLRIEHPATRDQLEKRGFDFQGLHRNTGQVRALQADGYDGVVGDVGRMWPWYVTFYPSQIKSADPLALDDSGELITPRRWAEEDNADIRFRRRAVTPEQDAEYMKAVEAGDMDTAQRMVEEAAKRAGKVSFGKYFVSRVPSIPKEMRDALQRGRALAATHKQAGAYRDMSVHEMRAQAPDFPDGKLAQIMYELGWRGYGEDELVPTVAYRIGDIPPNGLSRDAASGADEYGVSVLPIDTNREPPSGFYDDMLSRRGTRQYVAGFRNPYYDGADGEPLLLFPVKIEGGFSDIKSAAPVTRDDAGRVIPLSERFNAESADIRFRRGSRDDNDYRGQHRAPTGEFGEGSLDAMDRTYPADVYDDDAARIYGDGVDSRLDAKAAVLIRRLRGKADAEVKVYRAVPKGVQSEIEQGDWVTPIREYAISHGKRFDDGYDIIERTVTASELFTEGNSIFEYGWQPKNADIRFRRAYTPLPVVNQTIGGINDETRMTPLQRSETKARRMEAHPGSIIERFNTLHDKLRTGLQDNLLPAQRLYESVMRKNGVKKLPDDMDFVQKARVHSSMLAQAAKRIDAEYIDPMLQALSKGGLTLDELRRYSEAKHAPFFNAMIAARRNGEMPLEAMVDALTEAGMIGDEIDPQAVARIFDSIDSGWAGKGLSDENAARIVAELEEKANGEHLKLAHERLMAMNRSALNRRVESGLMGRAEADMLQQLSPFYVPLHVEKADDDAGLAQTGSGGRNIGTREFKRALGHFGEENVDVIAQSLSQAYQAEDRALENESRKALLKFAEAYPDATRYEVIDKVPLERVAVKDEKTGQIKAVMVPKRDFGMRKDDPVIIAKVDGKKRYIKFIGPTGRSVAHAVKGDLLIRNQFLSLLQRYPLAVFKMVNTAFSPEFMLTNPQADFIDAMANLSADDLGKVRNGVVRNLPSAWRALAVYDRGRGTVIDTEAGRYLKEAADNGMMFDAKFYGDTDRIYEDLSKKLEKAGGTRGGGVASWIALKEDADGKGLPWLLAQMDRANGIAEMGTRLSIYISARKNGIGVPQAVELARNVTVDFHRKGNWSPILNTLYAFSNVGIQATYRMGGAMIKSKKGRQVAVSIVALGFVNGLLNAWMNGGDDDDGEDEYKKLDEWYKEGGAPFRDPITGKWVRVRMRGIPAALWYTGQKMADVMTGYSDPMEASGRIASKFVSDVLNPLGSSGSIAQTLSPTLTDPIIQTAENKKWTGRDLVPQGFDKHKPDSQKAYKTTPEVYKKVAEALNALGGGDEVTSGIFGTDISPETFKLWTEFIGGGTLRFITRSYSTAVKLSRGDEIDVSEIPFVRSFVYDPDEESRQNGRYWEARRKFDRAMSQYKGYDNAADKRRVIERYGYADPRTAEALKTLDERINRLRENEERIKDPARKDALRKRRLALQNRYAERID